MTEPTLTTQIPGQPPQTRPVPPSWSSIALFLERWHMALVPHRDGTWDVLAGFDRLQGPVLDARFLRFHDLPQAIADLAAQCEQAAAAWEAGAAAREEAAAAAQREEA